ncbi:hypothetical protein ONZ43_g4523 [Nemania bipapillata]|uniref:Uncharacterized protein n=1 Tax=Nemania bipapillata TaxID=110536 RepID=A0ACC2ILT0_9PEZI|nr:hypothetical protein ONZ43_g4523 [Nemania bipapillata]
MLGKDRNAEVFIRIAKSTGQFYAVKIYTIPLNTNEKAKEDRLRQELATLHSVSHPNILDLIEFFNEEDKIYLVLDLAPERELFELVVQKSKLTEPETRAVFQQLFHAVQYLRDRNIVHRDIKLENIMMMDKNFNLKLAEFDLAKIIGDEDFTTTFCGTLSYAAPEILAVDRGRKHTKAVDVWSLEVVLYICFCGFPPFSDELYSRDFPYSLSQQIKSGRFDYPSPYWDSVRDPASKSLDVPPSLSDKTKFTADLLGLVDLIDHMLVVEPEKRFTIGQCLAHPWMTEGGSSSVPGVVDELNEMPHLGLTREWTPLSTINNIDPDEVFRDFDQVSPAGVTVPTVSLSI